MKVHRHNRKYGHDLILKAYCGVSLAERILGEVQHSFFVSNHHFDSSGVIGPPRTSGKSWLAPLFSWNGILPFRHQIPIGDPLIYSDLISDSVAEETCGKTLTHKDQRVLVMPKMNQELSPDDRVRDYLNLIAWAKEIRPSSEPWIQLHPLDLQLSTKLGDAALVVKEDERGAAHRNPGDHTIARTMQMSKFDLLVSDYIGAHSIRANAFFGAALAIHSAEHSLRPIHPSMRSYVHELSDPGIDPIEARKISSLLLGFAQKRAPDELADLLFHPALVRPIKRIWLAGYQKRRRVLVRVRNSRFLGKSPVIKRLRRQIGHKIWARRFD